MFSRIGYSENDFIVTFFGEELIESEWRRRKDVGLINSYYSIQTTSAKTGTFLDCYEKFTSKQCLASSANSPLNCWNIQTNRAAEANATIRMSQRNDGPLLVRLIATRSIAIDDEILWNYGHGNFWTPE